MKSENWNQVKEVLDEILEISPAEREEYLNDKDIPSDIRREVESLISFEDSSQQFTDLSAVKILADSITNGDDESKNALLGQNVGAYRVVREIGFGGMGVVYLAYRVDGKFEQTVALKLLKRELNTEALRRRFGNERTILATLNHPNIARLLDAGTTADGIPFLAMEYIEGAPIDIFCDKKGLGLEDRLSLFRKVCAAVDFAHRNLVVHRDLKPSNILITENGTPKLLDFGIAKLLNPEFEEEYEHTITRFGVMTPGYASPEQMKHESVTTSTDIYSLGVILYELLTGYRPFEEAEGDLKEIYQKIVEENPSLPSALASQHTKNSKVREVLRTDTDNSSGKENLSENPTIMRDAPNLETEVNKSLHTKPVNVRLSPNYLRGDLDNIVLKALKKEPERRYSSAANFSEDIRRHQAGLPVSARPEIFSYVAGKFIRRNRWAVASAGLILITLIGGVVATLWQAQIARTERDKAQKRFNEVRALANSFLFEITPEVEKLAGATKTRELIVKRALEYLDGLAQEAGSDAELQHELALAYTKVGGVQGNPYEQNVGDGEAALKSYQKAEVIFNEIRKAQPDDIKIQDDYARLLASIGDIYFYQEETDKAKEYYTRSQKLLENVIAREPDNKKAQQKLAGIYNELGLVVFWDGKNKEALEIYGKARKVFEKLYRENPENQELAKETANNYIRIGEVLGWEERTKEAGELLQKGLDMTTALVEKNPKDKNMVRTWMLAWMRRAENYVETNDFAKGIEFHQKAEEIAKNTEQQNPEDKRAKRDLVIISYKVAEALDMGGRSKEALEKLKEVLSLQRKLAGLESNPFQYSFDIANTLKAIGDAYKNLKNYPQALQSFEESIAKFKASSENETDSQRIQRNVAVCQQNIGEVYAAQADSNNDKALYQKALQNFESSFDIYTKLKKQGILAEFDIELLEKAEKQVKETRGKIKN